MKLTIDVIASPTTTTSLCSRHIALFLGSCGARIYCFLLPFSQEQREERGRNPCNKDVKHALCGFVLYG
jgi:hypothetical protein